jgi:hypothetical protein
MLTCYFDESHEGEFGLTLVCGWIASDDQWQRFDVDWRLLLAKYDVPYFHMKEFAHSVGPFEKWKGKEGTRRAFIRTAADIIIDTIQHGFVCVVSDQMFEECDSFYELRSKFRSPYALAGRTCANLAAEWAWASSPTSFPPANIEYVFEDGGPDKGGLLYAMQEISPSFSAPTFKPGKDQKPTRKRPSGRSAVLQLQAADYLAYEISKFGREHRNIKEDPSKFRVSLGILPERKVKRMFFKSRQMDLVCKMLNIKTRERP